MANYSDTGFSGIGTAVVEAGASIYNAIRGAQKIGDQRYALQSAITKGEYEARVQDAALKRQQDAIAADAEEFKKQLTTMLPVIGIIGVAAVAGILFGKKKRKRK